MKMIALAALLVLSAAANCLADEKPVHLFILSGQSNMAGMEPKLGLVPEAEKLFPEAEVVYFKVARGGQPIRLWVSQWNSIAEQHGLDIRTKAGKNAPDGTLYYQPILKEFENILKKHPHPASVTFCWMQGERDAKEKLSAAYAAALRQLIGNLRNDLKQPNMNVVVGRLSDCGKPEDEHWQKVRTAQMEVGAEDRSAWVDCDDLNDKEKNGVPRNDLHYTKEGYELLGRRYVRQAKALIEGREPAADGRPQ